MKHFSKCSLVGTAAALRLSPFFKMPQIESPAYYFHGIKHGTWGLVQPAAPPAAAAAAPPGPELRAERHEDGFLCSDGWCRVNGRTAVPQGHGHITKHGNFTLSDCKKKCQTNSTCKAYQWVGGSGSGCVFFHIDANLRGSRLVEYDSTPMESQSKCCVKADSGP